MSTDEEWERWGARDPYFGVLTHEKYRRGNLSDAHRQEFLESGRLHAEYVLGLVRTHVLAGFQPRRVLDFGCGVGRVLIPFAQLADEAVGVDVSPSMRAEAARNCSSAGVHNVQLVASDDELTQVQGQFDLVHSCIVLQHIELARGRALFCRLVERIRPGGVGALHVTFGWNAFPERFGQPPAPPPPQARSRLRQLLSRVKTAIVPPPPPPSGAAPDGDPEMQMNFYNLSELMFVLREAGVERVHVELTDHGGAYGAFLLFRCAGPHAAN
ncbi:MULTISPECIES: class I SAM-dependent methyltransferase [unclassified Rubrivivax]|uniref:class I SAM-dependent methyltransferase n=1 Tax=unclassified Rubrivivax TaxID=2649762 RepID=UPI001E5A8BC5|nr:MULTISPECIES: class I SAM-dependent methyltransferase [unclassified Rubrivivax]MCC9595496.1 class I SAM-dependent methyltransferase [Rubrivivax sp. JA1055]MCC9646997.1 class I SAM-dependent methyltransferase [Rubrivivax sp. JA1029]